MSDNLNQNLDLLRIDRRRKSGARIGRQVLVIGLVAIVLLIAATVSFGPKSSRLLTLGDKAQEVETTTVVCQSASAESVVLAAGGYIIPRQRVDVSPKITGRVEQLLVDKGDVIKQGQILARLDDREILAQLAQSRATHQAAEARLTEAVAGSRPEEIQRALASLEQAEANLKAAKINLDRARQLNRAGVFSKQALDDLQNAYDVAGAQEKVARQNYELARLGTRKEEIELARAQLAEAEASVRWWEAQLENTIIRAPVSGTILERLIEKGEMVTTGLVSERGAKAALVSIADLKDLEVELDINESDIPRVFMRQECTVSPDSYPDRKYKGRVREIAPEANRQKATIQVKVAILGPDAYLRPETNAKVNFLEGAGDRGRAADRRIVVPKSAVVPGPAVFVVIDGRAARRGIQPGKELWGQVEVTGGLVEGEQLIVRGIQGLKGGERVAPKK